MKFDIASEYSKPLPGDIVITFDKAVNVFPYTIAGSVAFLVVIILAIVIFYLKRRPRQIRERDTKLNQTLFYRREPLISH